MKDRKAISGEGGAGGDIVDRANDAGFTTTVAVVTNKNAADIIGARVASPGTVRLMRLSAHSI